MRVHWFFVLLSLALLLPPLPWPAAMQRALPGSRRSGLVGAGATLRLWQNWADLLRAAFGGYILAQWAITADLGIPGSELRVLSVMGALLSVALLFQTVRPGPRVQLVAPVFYLCGLTLSLSGYEQGGFALGVGWLFALGGKNLSYQLPAMAVALVAAGFVLGQDMLLLLNCALILLPLVLSVLFRKKLHFAAATLNEDRPTKQPQRTAR